ncbi:HD family hydrolase [Petrotoga sp. 9PWA.NaAc.5.4]|uniref:HD domain-containing protein n=1 Tax=Petrotoga sp. 9PWA.NaAc.5.4 TaxID=1434328 RepID=UPI000CAB1260|nr:YfbR-like 5'-deoxynucleotidase [Petrotoga sp. 9PWA.NaAc.5.4]PNR92867.1 hypothetical protein X924_08940 [Petrotoga sp. 9PWA.NaAc.5.4]
MNIGQFILDSTDLFTVFRWNNNPSLIRFTEADNIYNTLLLSLFIFSDDSKVKVVKILQNKIYETIPKIVLSDISLTTKNKIEEKGKDIWNKTVEKAFQEVESKLDKKITERMFNKHTFDESTENKIKLINLLVTRKEAEINERVFPEYYKEPKMKNEMKAKRIILSNKHQIELLCEELLNISTRLVTMTRWNKNHRNIKTSVSSHSFFVFLISYLLALISNLETEIIYDVMAASILHDLPEAFTGDVISPTKRKVKGLEEIINEIEKEFVHEWSDSKSILKEKVDKFEKYIFNPFKNTYGKYVKTADLLAALIECSLEISTGNQNSYFLKTFDSIKRETLQVSPLDINDIIYEIEKETFIRP